jgi:spermidine/putrescine-binding protein
VNNEPALQVPRPQGLTRRQLVQRGAALAMLPAVGGLLAACGSKDSADGASGPAPLNTILWAGFFENSLPGFEKQHNIKVTNRNQVDPIQTASLLNASPGQYDIVIFGPFDTPEVSQGLVIPPDLDRIRNGWDAQYPYFRRMWDPKVFAPESYGGKVWTPIYQWGSTVLAWNTKRIPDAPKSWSIMADPAYKARTSFNDQAAEMYGTLAVALRRNPDAFSPADLDATNGLADRWFDNAKTLWSTGDDIKQLMAQEEVWVAHIWDGTARQLVKEGYPIDFTYPVEGVRGYTDGVGIVKDTPHLDAAYDFVNFATSKEFGIALASDTLWATGNQQAADALDPKIKQIMRVDEMAKMLETGKIMLQKPTPDDFAALDKWWSAQKLKHQ